MNHIVLACLSTSVVGLVMIYLFASWTEAESVDLSDVNQELIGRTIMVEGFIKQKSVHDEGHIFLTISDGSKSIQSPIFSDLAKEVDANILEVGTKLKVTGVVDDYRNQMQVIPRKPGDIVLLGG